MDTAQNPLFIQTNHGVSFPLVGPNRAEQEDLFDSNQRLESEPAPVASTEPSMRSAEIGKSATDRAIQTLAS